MTCQSGDEHWNLLRVNLSDASLTCLNTDRCELLYDAFRRCVPDSVRMRNSARDALRPDYTRRTPTLSLLRSLRDKRRKYNFAPSERRSAANVRQDPSGAAVFTLLSPTRHQFFLQFKVSSFDCSRHCQNLVNYEYWSPDDGTIRLKRAEFCSSDDLLQNSEYLHHYHFNTSSLI